MELEEDLERAQLQSSSGLQSSSSHLIADKYPANSKRKLPSRLPSQRLSKSLDVSATDSAVALSHSTNNILSVNAFNIPGIKTARRDSILELLNSMGSNQKTVMRPLSQSVTRTLSQSDRSSLQSTGYQGIQEETRKHTPDCDIAVNISTMYRVCALCRVRVPKESTSRFLAKHVMNLRYLFMEYVHSNVIN